MTTKLTALKRQTESNKDVKTEKRQALKDEKQKVTLHLPLDVIEHLMMGKARKLGSMSDQVTTLVRAAIKSVPKP